MENSNENNATINDSIIAGDFHDLEDHCNAEELAELEVKAARKAANAEAKAAIKAHCQDATVEAASTLASAARNNAARFVLSDSASRKLATAFVGATASLARKVIKG